MKVYIASSWKNRLAVELLTDRMRDHGIMVTSFVEAEGQTIDKYSNFEDWFLSEDAQAVFSFDTEAIKNADLIVYVGPSGTDTWFELGMAYALFKPIIGIWVKGEMTGLMRKSLMVWTYNANDLLKAIRVFKEVLDSKKIVSNT